MSLSLILKFPRAVEEVVSFIQKAKFFCSSKRLLNFWRCNFLFRLAPVDYFRRARKVNILQRIATIFDKLTF